MHDYFMQQGSPGSWVLPHALSTLVSNEGDGHPVVEFFISQGVVLVKANPTELLTQPQEPPYFMVREERGCSSEMLKNALDLTRRSVTEQRETAR